MGTSRSLNHRSRAVAGWPEVSTRCIHLPEIALRTHTCGLKPKAGTLHGQAQRSRANRFSPASYLPARRSSMSQRNKVRLARQAEPELEAIMTHYKEFWDADVTTFFSKLYQAGGLDEKTTELVVTSLLALRGWETGVRTHVWQALDVGATPEEVRGAILISMSVGG